MKQKLLLLLTALMLLTTGNAWGVDYLTTYTGVVGAIGNTSGFNTKGSKQMSLAAGDEYVITFVNYNNGASGTDYWENWAFCSNVFNCRADHGASNPYWGSATNVNYTGNSWSDIYSSNTQWLRAYNGVTVTLTVSRNATGDGITISHTATTNAVDAIVSQTYAGTFTATVGASAEINFYLTVEDAHVVINKVVKTNTADNSGEIYIVAEHTAGAQWGSNTGASTVDADKEHYNNDASSAWAGCAYAKFVYSELPDGMSINSASVTYSVNQGGKYGRDDNIYYMAKDFDIDWANFAGQTGTDLRYTSNRGGTAVAAAATGGIGDRINLNQSVMGAVSTIYGAGQKYILFQWTGNAGGADLYGKGSDAHAPELGITYSKETLYTATFTETNSLNPTVSIYSDSERTIDVDNGELHDGTTYYYRAVLEGYNNYEGSFTVSGANPDVNFTMTAKTRYTFKVNAVNSVGGAVLKTIYEDTDSYEGKVQGNIVYPKYLTGANNIVTYSKDNNTYGESKTAQAQDETYTVSYTAYDGIAYFIEVEDVVSATGYGSWNCSNGGAVRGFTNARNIFTVPATGVYDVTYAACNNNVNYDLEITLSKNETEIATKSDFKSVSINKIKTTGIVSNNNVSLTSGDVLKLTPSTTNGIVDYMLIELKSVSGTIASSGYSSLATPCGLDFAKATGLTAAYVVSEITKTAVRLTSVDALPANRGVILKGTPGATYSIPVKADASYDGTNKLYAAVTAYDCDANEVYILQSGLFHLVTAASTVPAGKAYLKAEDVPTEARTLIFCDEEDPTAINAVKATEAEAQKDGKYLENGKIVIVKNGIKYSANGQKLN